MISGDNSLAAAATALKKSMGYRQGAHLARQD
jgi:hypothetical protein